MRDKVALAVKEALSNAGICLSGGELVRFVNTIVDAVEAEPPKPKAKEKGKS